VLLGKLLKVDTVTKLESGKKQLSWRIMTSHHRFQA
jgi:hypothetical protein